MSFRSIKFVAWRPIRHRWRKAATVVSSWARSLRAWRTLLSLMLDAGRSLNLALLSAQVTAGVLPLALIAASAIVLSSVVQHQNVSPAVIVFGLLLLLQQAISPLCSVLSYQLTRRVDANARNRVLQVANAPVGIGHLRDPDYLEVVSRCSDDANPFINVSMGASAAALLMTFGRYARAGAAAALIALQSLPAAAILLVAAISVRSLTVRWSIAEVRAYRGSQHGYRSASYAASLATTAPGAKELRIYGLSRWLRARHRREWQAITGAMSHCRWELAWRKVAVAVALTPIVGASMGLLIERLGQGRTSIQAIVAGVAGCVVLTSFAMSGHEDDLICGGLDTAAILTRVNGEARNGRVQLRKGRQRSAIDIPSPWHELRFAGVGFSYPGGPVVLNGLDLAIRAGTKLAIAGANGAGKTTIARLIALLEKPTEGSITLDGVLLDNIDPILWRTHLAMVFQDFVRFELSVADNIMPGSGRDHYAALAYAAERAGLTRIIDELPLTWDTILSCAYRDGTDVSGGEWQRIALARAFFALEVSASLLVLDEPSSQLDPTMEETIFRDYLDAKDGLTSIIMSHRLSTARRATRIAFLEGGRIVEEGSHIELMQTGGPYAQMFRGQRCPAAGE